MGSPEQAAGDSTAFRVGDGAHVGDITVQGDVAGRDIIKITEELTYDVSDLAHNPYCGLASFTYATRAFYSGRQEQTSEALARLTEPGQEAVLLFVTGASGSGKSSFAQAGVQPALEAAYLGRGRTVRWAVIRPGRHPVAALGRALEELHLPAPAGADWVGLLRTPDDLNQILATQTPADQVNVVVFDQFEELFTQAEPGERDTLCGLLSGLEPFGRVRSHVIATLRADYLSSLFGVPALFAHAKRAGVELRAMQPHELARAIRAPLQEEARREAKTKRIDPALVARLVEDVGSDASLLPLLQVTLTALWDEPPHQLRLERYRSLTDALEQQAEGVYARDRLGHERPQEQRQAILGIFLDLVEVSLDDDARRDVRHTVSKNDLVGGRPERAALIDELVEARLLATAVEQIGDTGVEVVDIIHETLLRNWPRLAAAIADQREALQQRERFRLNLREWQQNGRSAAYLLEGVRLAEARTLAARNDIVLQRGEARELLETSGAAEAAERTRALQEARRRQRVLGTVAGVAIVFAVAALGAAGYALVQRQVALNSADAMFAAQQDAVAAQGEAVTNAQQAKAAAQTAFENAQQATAAKDQAVQNAQLATSRELASSALAQLSIDPELSLLLAQQAVTTARTSEAEDALRQALRESRVRLTIRPNGGVHMAALSPDGQRVVAIDGNGSASIWKVEPGSQPLALQGRTGPVTTAGFSPDSQRMATAGQDGTVDIWDAASGAELGRLSHATAVQSVEFNAGGSQLLTLSSDGTAHIWDLASHAELKRFRAPGQPAPQATRQIGPPPAAHFIAGDSRVVLPGVDGKTHVWDPASDAQQTLSLGQIVSPDGAHALRSSSGDAVSLLDSDDGSAPVLLPGDLDPHGDEASFLNPNLVAGFSPDGSLVATVGLRGTLKVWQAQGGSLVSALPGHAGAILSAAFSADGRRIVTGGSDGTVRVWNVAGGSVVLRGHTDQVLSAAFDRSGSRVLSVSRDGSARVWDLPIQVGDRTSAIDSAALDPDASRVLLVSHNRVVQVWDAGDGRKLVDTRAPGLNGEGVSACAAKPTPQVAVLPPAKAAFSPTGAVVLSAGAEPTARVWEAASGRTLTTCYTGTTVQSIVFSADGRYAGVPTSPEVQAWDVASGQSLDLPSGFDDLVFSPDGTRAVLTGKAGVQAWDVQARAPTLRLIQGVQAGAPRLTSDGTRLAAVVDPDTVHVWDLPSGRELTAFHVDNLVLAELALSADGQRVLGVSLRDGRVREAHVWDAATGQQLEMVSGVISAAFSPAGSQVLLVRDGGPIQVGEPGALRDLAQPGSAGSAASGASFSPDGRRLLSWHRDGSLRVWDAATGAPIDVLRDHVGPITTASFSGDGAHIVSAGEDGMAEVYGCEVTCGLDDLLTLAQTRSTRALTPDERRQYLHES